MSLWLIGMMGSGKSTCGELAAQMLNVPFSDTDRFVADRMGCSVAQLWGAMGEEAFRDMEQLAVSSLADAGGIVATGGGAVMNSMNRQIIASGKAVIWLEAPPSVLERRLGAGEARPGLISAGLSSMEFLTELLTERSPTYATLATHRIDTSNEDVTTIAKQICDLWNA